MADPNYGAMQSSLDELRVENERLRKSLDAAAMLIREWPMGHALRSKAMKWYGEWIDATEGGG